MVVEYKLETDDILNEIDDGKKQIQLKRESKAKSPPKSNSSSALNL